MPRLRLANGKFGKSTEEDQIKDMDNNFKTEGELKNIRNINHFVCNFIFLFVLVLAIPITLGVVNNGYAHSFISKIKEIDVNSLICGARNLEMNVNGQQIKTDF